MNTTQEQKEYLAVDLVACYFIQFQHMIRAIRHLSPEFHACLIESADKLESQVMTEVELKLGKERKAYLEKAMKEMAEERHRAREEIKTE